MFHQTETLVIQAVSWLRLMVESVGALIIPLVFLRLFTASLKRLLAAIPMGLRRFD